MGCCTGCGRVCSGVISRSGSGRGRRSISGIAAGRRMAPGRCCCRGCRPPKTLRETLTGRCRWTPPRCAPTSTLPARSRSRLPQAPKGGSAGGGDESGRSGAAEIDGAVGGGGPIGECLGRSRGGFTTKIHLAADGRCRPLAVVLTPGHYGDSPQFERVLTEVSVPRIGVGRPRTRPDHILADKAYTSRRNRRYLRRRGIPHTTIPERLDQQRHRENRGSRGGRPTGFGSERYKKPNTVDVPSTDSRASVPLPPATRIGPTTTSAPSSSRPSQSGSELIRETVPNTGTGAVRAAARLADPLDHAALPLA